MALTDRHPFSRLLAPWPRETGPQFRRHRHRVEICNHHNGKYRVNIWQQPESDKSLAVSLAARIGRSYYLTVSEAGEIVASNPPLTKLGSSA